MGTYKDHSSVAAQSLSYAHDLDGADSHAAQRVVRFRRPEPAKDEDALPTVFCGRCGCKAAHAGPLECIDALRDRLADYTAREL